MKTKTFYNTKIFNLLKYLGVFILFFIAGKAGINNLIFPFAFGVFFAFMWCNQNIFIMLPLFIFSQYLCNFSVNLLISNIIFSIIFIIIYLIHLKIKKPFKLLHILIYACICNIPKIVTSIALMNTNIYLVFIELLLGLLFTFACLKFFECLCVRGITGRLTSVEVICAMIFIGALFCGISTFNFGDFYLVKFAGALFLLIMSYMGNTQSVLLSSSAMAVGCLLNSNNLEFFIAFILYGIVALLFKTKNKYFTIVALIGIECFCGFYLNLYKVYNVVSILPIFISSLIYLVIPYKVLDKYGNEFQESLCSITQQSVINRNREMLYARLVELSDVFSEMNKIFRGMINGGIMGTDAKRLLLSEVKAKNCKDCPNQGKCFRVFADETTRALNMMIDSGFEKGRVNILDVPTLFAGKCEKLNSLVCSINDLIAQYKSYAGLMNNIDASKVLLAEQLGGVSTIMRELSKEVNKGVSFEKGKEKRIIDELIYNNIICSDVLVFQDSADVLSVTLAIRKEDVGRKCISKIVSKVCGAPMEVYDEASSSRAGFSVLTLKSAPKYEVVFGVATKTKTGSVKSGDSYSVIKIKNGKYLFAICDGMGSGDLAEETSSTALGLLENFYKAGFDKEIILSSVNKLLSLRGDETFSALDLCVVDTINGIGDFIKMGAPESFVKHKNTTDTIKIEALPMGIIQNAKPSAKEVYLSSGDKIIMCSDGITDGFKNVEELCDFVNNIIGATPQCIADKIVERVLQGNRNIAKDDMTVIVAKIFEK